MPSLMSLPTEVRMIIWEAILPEEVIFQALREEEPSKLPPNPVLSLLLVCRQAKSEAETIPTPLLVAVMNKRDFHTWVDNTSIGHRTLVNIVQICGTTYFVDGKQIGCDGLWLENRKGYVEDYWRKVELVSFSGWEMTKCQGTWFYPDIATGSVKFKVSEPEE